MHRLIPNHGLHRCVWSLSTPESRSSYIKLPRICLVVTSPRKLAPQREWNIWMIGWGFQACQCARKFERYPRDVFSRESGGRSCTRDVTEPQIYVRPKPEKNEDISIVCRVAKTPFSYTIHNSSKPKNHFFRFSEICTTLICIRTQLKAIFYSTQIGMFYFW